MSTVSTSPSAVPSTSVARVESWPTSARKLALALLGDRRQMSQAVALGQRDGALEHDEHAGADFSRFEQFFPVRIFA